ncbi:MAG: TrkH family potassium uptake protein [Ectobacillus sp.]
MKRTTIHMSPPRFLILSFLALALAGTCLLKLPISTTSPISWVDALFTAVSACTVTGLGVVDTGTVFTLFGQLVILCLIQVGGLGIMSFAILSFIVLGKKIGLQNRILMQQTLNQTSIGGIIRLARTVLLFAFAVELVAMLLLALEWVPKYGWKKGLYFSFFHAVSAFNNAGFSIWPDSLMRHVGNTMVNLVITSLIIIGGLGFTVFIDIWKKRSFSRLSLHSKLMIISTIAVNIGATLFILFFEYNNTASMGGLTTYEKVLGAYFQSITTRTAGFNTVDIGKLTEPVLLLMLLLMFVGAGSASTGGGVKLTTILVMLFGVTKFLREQDDIVIFKKSIKDSTIVKALSISFIAVVAIFLAVLFLSITEDAPILMIVFEVVSAFGTVGITMGLTAKLTMAGKLLITCMMLFGKLGPLTIAFALAKKQNMKVKYPTEDILTG